MCFQINVGKIKPMIKTIDDALDIIYSYVDYSMTHAKDLAKEPFSLKNIRALLSEMGNPQKNYPIIHVAGTKGKGSVCAMLSSALQNAGFKTGLYTSPHLIRFNERIMVDGEMISDREVVTLTEKINSAVKSVDRISSFEFMTAMAFEYFHKEKVDVAIVETGLGGRLDATNVADPVLTIITSVSQDHMNFLGDTIEKIAAEKAGIIKPNIPVICSYQPYENAKAVIKSAADKSKSPWINVPERYHYINQRGSQFRDSIVIWRTEDQKLAQKWASGDDTGDWAPAVIGLPLAGQYQMENAAAVYAAICKLKSIFNLDISKASAGISDTFWPCRFERLMTGPDLITDGAHNTDSISRLANVIDRYYGTKKVKCIFGASEDKNLQKMIYSLAPHVDEFIMTRSTHPRAADPEELSRIASETGRKNRWTSSLEDAFAVFESEKDENTCYIATGSLFVAGGIRELCMKKDDKIRYFAYHDQLSEK